MSELKSDFWIIDANQMVRAKVIFEEPVTKAEAMSAFESGDYADVLDEEDYGAEAVGAEPVL